VKFDGHRMQVHKASERVYTRNGADWPERFRDSSTI
jgi:ATP-dependent DNA ligase